MKKTFIKKGYTLTVVSWENDEDNYKTLSQTYDNLEYVKVVAKICKELFVSCNNGKNGIGNTNEGDENDAKKTILEYLKNNTIFENQELLSDNEKIFKVMNINYNLMGHSEWYYSRVFESLTLVYSPEDICLELIQI